MTSKKILIFSTAYFPFVGGAEIAVKEITDRIADCQFDMITARIDRKLPKFEKIGNVNVYRFGFGIPKCDKYLLAFWGHCFGRKLHKKNQYCAIWSIMASYGGFAALAFKKKNPKVPFLLTLQEGDDPGYIEQRVGFLKSRFREIFKKADYIQCISNFLADWAEKNGAKCPIEVVPNGVDMANFSKDYSEKEMQELKNKLSIRENEKIITTTSRLVEKNAIGDAIEAMRYLPDNVKFLILGAGPDFTKLQNLIKELEVEKRVMFLGQVDHKELPRFLKISDIFVRPSLSEGLGSSFLEAMVAGIPVIATPVGGISDFLRDRETGLFCEVRNPKSIAEKVGILLENNELREKVITNARELVVKNYDWNLIAEKMRNIFIQLSVTKSGK